MKENLKVVRKGKGSFTLRDREIENAEANDRRNMCIFCALYVKGDNYQNLERGTLDGGEELLKYKNKDLQSKSRCIQNPTNQIFKLKN